MSLEPAEVIQGKYRIVRLIGEGGMGAVYEGENTRINRRVAIKVLHAGFASNTDVVRRFEREAQAAGRIGNDHITRSHSRAKGLQWRSLPAARLFHGRHGGGETGLPRQDFGRNGVGARSGTHPPRIVNKSRDSGAGTRNLAPISTTPVGSAAETRTNALLCKPLPGLLRFGGSPR